MQSDIVNEGLKHIPASHAQMQALNVASLGQTWIRLHPESSQIPENITSLQQLKSGLPPEVANNQNNVGKYWEATLVQYSLPAHFPYVRDWLNEHPFRNEPDARLICNLQTGAPVTPDALWKIMKQPRKRIIHLLENDSIRHSSISYDSDYLPEYALKKKVRWSMNSKQGSRYIKRKMGNDLKQKILVQNGIISEQQVEKKPSILNCPRCSLVNAVDNKYCSKCSYPLVPSAFDEIKEAENRKIHAIEEGYKQDIKHMQEEMNQQFGQIMSMIQQNPQLANIKPEVMSKKVLIEEQK